MDMYSTWMALTPPGYEEAILRVSLGRSLCLEKHAVVEKLWFLDTDPPRGRVPTTLIFENQGFEWRFLYQRKPSSEKQSLKIKPFERERDRDRV